MRHKIREADIRRKTQTKTISDFLKRVMPDTKSPSNRATSFPSPEPELAKHLIFPNVGARKRPKTRRMISPSSKTSTSRDVETPKQGFIPGNDDDNDDESVKEEKLAYGKDENVGTVASPP